MKKSIIAVAAIAIVGMGGQSVVLSSGSTSEAQAISAEAPLATASFSIENMTCATCPISVRKAMMRVEGVKTVDIDFDSKIASVTFDPAVTTADAIAAASTNVGYPATRSDA
ncbi:heavy-metal-associated domain-containing protein [Hyphomonas chukchiensis]|uniref:heavy-metal-associated domain-containing protein n=1 Tax=Hyphomonas chukchiensis TaxID=1280947 RepID=UPI0030F552D8